MFSRIEKNFPLVIVLVSVAALIHPQLFLWVKSLIAFFLGLIMFCIGLTLSTDDFKQVFKLRWQIVALAILKYTLLPFLAYFIGFMLHLSNNDLIGLMIISACPGGTAAGVMSYLSRSNVALTVVLTLVTTVLSPLVTPLIIYLFLHKHVPIPVKGMAIAIFWVVLFPLLDGFIVRKFLKSKIEFFKPILPLISIAAISLIIGCVVALNHLAIQTMPVLATLAVTFDNFLGLALGYLLAKKLLKLSKEDVRAVSFEFGILDTGMAVMLAVKFFGVATSLCAAIFSAMQNITGAVLTRFFRAKATPLLNRRTLTNVL